MELTIKDGIKQFRSETYNYNFNLSSGYFERWGKTIDEDPIYSPYGPEIVDFEVDEVCSGIPNKNGKYIPCPMCYKANVNTKGNTMTFETFKGIFDKFPTVNGIPFISQIAFGATDINHNKDLWKMMDYCRKNFVVPNITINGAKLTEEIINNLIKYTGAISVSCYDTNPEVCYSAIDTLIKAGHKQINMHICYYEENKDFVKSVIEDIHNDKRLKNMNAVVLLALKQKGRGSNLTAINDTDFQEIIEKAFEYHIGLGFDSCSFHRVKRIFNKMGILSKYESYMEPCESFGLFSSYINVNGKYSFCSFCEDTIPEVIDVLNIKDFIVDLWESNMVKEWRIKSLNCQRDCPVFKV